MWQRLDETKLKNLGGGEPGDETPGEVRRAYGLHGKPWPRIVLSLLPDKGRFQDETGQWVERPVVRVGISEKRGPGAWWHEVPLPVELCVELSSLLVGYRVLSNLREDEAK
jgi:hypothetical protein